jgi:hypothetical protein
MKVFTRQSINTFFTFLKKGLCLFLSPALSLFALLSGIQPSFANAQTTDVDVIVSVDWEGEDLSDANLAAMEEFRRDYPQIPLTHFLNAAYFTSGQYSPQEATARIRRGLKPCDEFGLHIHGWKDLFEASFQAAGLRNSTYKNGPAFWGPQSSPLGNRVGHDVPIKLYSREELQSVIRFSLQTLKQNGLSGSYQSFRAGGWMADDQVLAAVAQEGFSVDSSAIPPEFLQMRINGSPLFSNVEELWGSNGAHPTTDTTAPYTILPGLTEVPGALFADYVTDNYIDIVMRDLLRTSRPILHLSFHEETANQFLYILREILSRMQSDYTEGKGIRFHFRTLTPTSCESAQ